MIELSLSHSIRSVAHQVHLDMAQKKIANMVLHCDGPIQKYGDVLLVCYSLSRCGNVWVSLPFSAMATYAFLIALWQRTGLSASWRNGYVCLPPRPKPPRSILFVC